MPARYRRRKGDQPADFGTAAFGEQIMPQHIYQWGAELRKFGEGLSGGANFLPVEMSTAASMSVAAPAVTSVEIVLANGRRLRGIEGLSPAGLTQLIRVLESA